MAARTFHSLAHSFNGRIALSYLFNSDTCLSPKRKTKREYRMTVKSFIWISLFVLLANMAMAGVLTGKDLLELAENSLEAASYRRCGRRVVLIVDDSTKLADIDSSIAECEDGFDFPVRRKSAAGIPEIKSAQSIALLLADTTGCSSGRIDRNLALIHYDCFTASERIVDMAETLGVSAVVIPVFVDGCYDAAIHNTFEIPEDVVASIMVILGFKERPRPGEIFRNNAINITIPADEGLLDEGVPENIRWNDWNNYRYYSPTRRRDGDGNKKQ